MGRRSSSTSGGECSAGGWRGVLTAKAVRETGMRPASATTRRDYAPGLDARVCALLGLQPTDSAQHQVAVASVTVAGDPQAAARRVAFPVVAGPCAHPPVVRIARVVSGELGAATCHRPGDAVRMAVQVLGGIARVALRLSLVMA